MTPAETHFLAGLSHHKSGRAGEAERCYRAALAVEPRHFAALQHLGALCADRGASGEAADLFARAAEVKPSDPVIFFQLATALAGLERYADSLAAFDAAIALKSDIPLLHAGRGSALHALKRYDEAIAAYDRALTFKPNDALTIANRAAALRLAGRSTDALAAIERSLALVPGDAASLVIRALIRMEQGDVEKSLADFERALALQPQSGETYLRLGVALTMCGAFGAAVNAFSECLKRDPDNAEAYAERGDAFHVLHRLDEAFADCSKAIALDPGYAPAWHNRAITCLAMNRLDEALADADQALTLAPAMSDAAAVRFIITANRCEWPRRQQTGDDLLRCCQTAMAGNPFSLIFFADDPRLHRTAATRATGREERPRPSPKSHQRLRVGYLSSDFRDHVVAHQIVEVMERHDRAAFEIVGISLFPREAAPSRLVQAFDSFVAVPGLSDPDLASRIAGLDLDIVVDLNGHTELGRTRALAWRPAPIAVNYLGYPGTSGAPYIDYIVADAATIPPEAEEFYSEKVARLPLSFMPRDTTIPPGPPPSRAEAGLPETGLVFGGFANGYKIEPELFDVWMRLLLAVPGSILWLKIGDRTAQENLRREAAARDVAPERLIFAGRVPDRTAYLGRLKLIDVFLDTRCYGAHATASDLLWAGVPLVTVTGRSFATRVGAGLLKSAGLDDLIASDLDHYHDIALSLAQNPDRRAAVRAKLEAVRASLFDMGAYTRALESAYRTMMDQTRAGHSESFTVSP